MKKIEPAIVVVAYNRPESLKRLLNSISNGVYPSKNITLIISVDYGGDQKVLDIANDFIWSNGNKIVKIHKQKLGLKKHILECGDYSAEYGFVIVLEDDLFVSRDFYIYSINAHKKYINDERIAGISLYCNEWNNFSKNIFKPIKTQYTSYFRQVCESWGQSWSSNQWNKFKMWLDKNPEIVNDGKMPEEVYKWPETSWGKLFNNYVEKNNLFLCVPYNARSTCFSEIGQHTVVKDVSNQVCLQNDIPTSYLFPSYEEGIHYDMFFENIDLKEVVKKWTNNNPCTIDLYGLRKNYYDRYILTTKKMPYKKVRGFALEMRPIESNVIYNIPGEGIMLYDADVSMKNGPRSKTNYIDLYDLSGYPLDRIVKYAVYSFIKRAKAKIIKCFGGVE